MAAKPKKYPPANNPRSPEFNPSSWENTGDKVAVLALMSVDMKYPNANTKNTIIARFLVNKFMLKWNSFHY